MAAAAGTHRRRRPLASSLQDPVAGLDRHSAAARGQPVAGDLGLADRHRRVVCHRRRRDLAIYQPSPRQPVSARGTRRADFGSHAHALLDAAPNELAAQLSLLVRRTALAAFPREQIAPLSGAAWLAFLDRSSGGTEFSRGPGRWLASAPYAQTGPNRQSASCID